MRDLNPSNKGMDFQFLKENPGGNIKHNKKNIHKDLVSVIYLLRH